MVEPLRHRQTKGAATNMFYLTPPRHISTLPFAPRQLLGATTCMSASLIGRLGSSAFRLSTTTMSMFLTGSCFSSESTPGRSIIGFEDEVERSLSRPCRQCDGRSKRTCELTSSIVPRGTSFHRLVELEFPPIRFDPARFSCCRRGLFPGPPELGAVNPYAVHDHGQPARQRHDRLFHPAAPGDLHRPGLEP